ncbi:MAG: hypothetical protein L7H10_02105 [Vulcanisaeta sp.]|jgi:hypothetical protein|nr:hypothetical protein [Vulcanisaeta sp.]MCG2869525.1 hypothetical protein [Vulcanisaeta sp.]MCG2881174.1 hypothetical protein [Vulcanisaeta sp.]MCG2886747.1 hypothetical protein [Vulcanisaeta sp.]
MKLPEIEIKHRRFSVLPNKYAVLYMIWYSRNSTLQLYRLAIITYLSSHVIRYTYELPPLISKALINDLGSLINDGLLEQLTLNGRLALRVTDRGRQVIRELHERRDEYFLIGDFLIIKLGNLLNELSRIVSIYQDMDVKTLLSIAIREESLRERGLAGAILKDLAFELRSACENALG